MPAGKPPEYAKENPELLEDLLKTKRLPIGQLTPVALWSAKRWNGTANIW